MELFKPLSSTSVQNNYNLLSIIQADFPVVPRPFNTLAKRIGSSESELIDSIRSLKEEGVIRAFGPVFEARTLGYVSTLIAATVDEDRISGLAAMMLDINEITHNYLRNNERNLWFTITARNSKILNNIINQINHITAKYLLIHAQIKYQSFMLFT